jgi:hypothetical protein
MYWVMGSKSLPTESQLGDLKSYGLWESAATSMGQDRKSVSEKICPTVLSGAAMPPSFNFNTLQVTATLSSRQYFEHPSCMTMTYLHF